MWRIVKILVQRYVEIRGKMMKIVEICRTYVEHNDYIMRAVWHSVEFEDIWRWSSVASGWWCADARCPEAHVIPRQCSNYTCNFSSKRWPLETLEPKKSLHRPAQAQWHHQDVPRCAKMCQDVPRCAKMCQDVPRCAKMCQDEIKWFRGGEDRGWASSFMLLATLGATARGIEQLQRGT